MCCISGISGPKSILRVENVTIPFQHPVGLLEQFVKSLQKYVDVLRKSGQTYVSMFDLSDSKETCYFFHFH